jgi:DNA adenine methylase
MNKIYSPLRYPGGKRRLAEFLSKICIENDIKGHYIEPYAGGASVALYLLIEEIVDKITINDYDKSIYAFWYSVLEKTEELCELIQNTNVTIDEWRKFRQIQNDKRQEKDLLKLGFSTLFLNRTNYSGIINGGVIGGIKQKGKYKLDCRFNKNDIAEKIKLIARYKDKITLEHKDALKLIEDVVKDENTIFYFDPPYYQKGPSLYMNHYGHGDHKEVSDAIKKIKYAKWIVSYDETPEIQKLYVNVPFISYDLLHSVRHSRIGKEIIFFCNELKVDFGRSVVRSYD